jgi:hypothetical protein
LQFVNKTSEFIVQVGFHVGYRLPIHARSALRASDFCKRLSQGSAMQ